MNAIRRKFFDYFAAFSMYVREGRAPRDVLRLVRVRLSQSKVGLVVCRSPIVVDVDTASLGKGTRLRSHTTDIVVLNEILVGQSYEPLAVAAGSDVHTIVDLGACTGLASRWLLERFPSARLVAVEPESRNASMLRANLYAYGSRASVLEAGIGATERKVALVGAREDGFRIVDAQEAADTTVLTMDTVLSDLGTRRIDILKVDIEGTEEELFDACASWIAGVGVASIECHHPFTARALLDQVARAGVDADALRLDTSATDYDMLLLRVGGSR